jgi:phage terminase small subunit
MPRTPKTPKSSQTAAGGSTALAEKHERFAEEYAIDLNATQAAIRVGYSPETARQQGSRLLTNADIRSRVRELRAAAAEAAMVDAAWVRERLRENVERAMQVEEIVRDGKPTGEYVYQGSVANKALELLGKDRGMFTERHELSGPGGGSIPQRIEWVVVAPKKEDDGEDG